MRSGGRGAATIAGAGLAAIGALVVAGAGVPSRPAGPLPQRHVVEIRGMAFHPEALEVRQGDTVVWINRDIVPHTATSEEGGFDSKTIESNGSWTFRARKAGKVDYICTLHPTMKAVLQIR